jgi:AcrR family transcriptional regulator
MVMPHSTRQASSDRPRRRSGAQTRERLLAAALDLLHAGGEAAVTTVSLTRAAGIVQSAFYQHFSNVEECLATAAERICRDIREAVANHRRRMYESGPGTGPNLEAAYRDLFGLVSRQRALMQLFLRYRTDPLALGGVMHRFARDLRTDLAGQLAGQVRKAGLPDPPPAWLEALAESLVGASLAAVEAYLEGRSPGVEEAARLLAAFTTGACFGVYDLWRPAPR